MSQTLLVLKKLGWFEEFKQQFHENSKEDRAKIEWLHCWLERLVLHNWI